MLLPKNNPLGARELTLCAALLLAAVMACPALAQETAKPPDGESPPVQPEEKAPHFDVKEYRVSGNTLLEVKDLERALYSQLGKNKTFADIEQARKILEQRYRDAEYPAVIVDIPEQHVDGGVVWLKVTESRISTLRVSGTRYYSPRRLAEQVSALAPGNQLQFAVVQEQINQASAAYPGRAINPILRPGRTPGTVEAELKVQDTFPLYGSLEINDRNGENTSRWRTTGSVGYSNLWQRGHSLNLQYQTAPENTAEVKVWSGTYLFRVPSMNSLVALYGVKSKSNVAALGDISVLGEGNIAGGRWIVPWSEGEGINRSLTFGVDYKDFKESVFSQGSDTSNTPINYLMFGLDFMSAYRDGGKTTSLTIGTRFGVRGLGNTLAEFDNKRELSRPDFRIIHMSIEHERPLSGGAGLHLELDGQVSNSPLISNEEYGVGGSDTVRGYYESQLLGDNAVRARAEWRSPPLLGVAVLPNQDFHGLLFWDGAALHTKRAAAGQETYADLSSIGIGLRMAESPAWEARMDLARALVAAGSVKAGDMRWHAYFKYQF